MPNEQEFRVYLKFQDMATGKFVSATDEQIKAIKRLGIEVKREGTASVIHMDKMAEGMQKTERHTRYLGLSISKLAGQIGALRNMILVWLFALSPIINFTKEITEAAIKQEDAEMKLTAAFAATGKGTREGAKDLIDYASKLQYLTGVADDQIIAAEATLANFRLTDEQIKKTIPVVLDVAAAKQKLGQTDADVESVARRLGLALTGNANLLTRLGIVIDESVKKHGTFDEILKSIQKSAGGMATLMASTFQGQMNIAKIAISDFNEQLGFIIIKSPVVISALQLMTEGLKNQTTAITASREESENFLNTWKRLTAATIGVVESVKFLWRVFLEGLRGIEIAFFKIIEFFASTVVNFFEKIIIRITNFLPFLRQFSDDVQKIIDETKNWRDTAKITADNISYDLLKTATTMNNTVNTMVDGYAAIEAGAERVKQQQKSMAEVLGNTASQTVEDTKNTFNAMDTFMTAAVTGMRDTMVDGFFKVIKEGFSGLGDVVRSFGDMMLKTILQIAINMMMIKIGMGAWLGFPGGAVGHTGGLVYAENISYGLPKRKFHSGGEVPATLLEGEYVMNRNAVRNVGVDNLNKLNRGDSFGGTVVNNYYIQTIDERSFRERLQQHGDIYANASERGINDNTSLRKSSQRFG